MVGDPCTEGWFGVECGRGADDGLVHVVKLFPNTRNSGNQLVGCAIPSSIGDFTHLEHLYMSNDATMSQMHG